VATAHQDLRGPGGPVELSVRPGPLWLSSFPPEPARYYLHVLNSSTEGVCDSALMNGLLAEAKVCQFDVA
jgi:hypothetical protein